MDDDDKLVRNHPKTKGKWEESNPLEDLERGPSGPSRRYVDPYDNPPPPDLEEYTKPWAICVNCVHSHDPRPWWRQLFQRLPSRELLCSARPRDEAINPVTGRVTYTNSIFSMPSKGFSQPLERCEDMNLQGYCESFKRKED